MKRKLATILALSSAIIIYGGYYFGLPYILNKPCVNKLIQEKTFTQTGYRIEFINPKFKMGILPSAIISAEEFNLLNDDQTKAINIQNPQIKVSLLPLVLKKLEITKFNATDLTVNLIFDKNSQFKIGQYKIEAQKNSKINIQKAAIDLDGYNINLYDEVQNKNIKLKGDFFNLKEFKKDKHIIFATNSQLFVGEKASTINANVNINLPLRHLAENKVVLDLNIINLDLSDFTIYAKAISKNKIKELRGLINLTTQTKTIDGHKNIIGNILIKNLGIMQQDLASSIYSNNPISIKTDLNIINNGIKINNFKVLSKDTDFFINGNIYKTNAKYPILDLKTTINKISGKELLPLFPGDENLNPDFNFYKLKKYMIYGIGTGNIDIKGQADYPELYGNILLTDVYLIQPIKDAPKNATIKISLNQHKMDLKAHVLTTPSEYVDVKGTFNLFRNRYTDLYIKTTENIELTKAIKVVMPLHEILKFELGPLPMMKISGGTGMADLHITGSKTDPHSWGYIKFKNGTASFITINNMVAKRISGNVKFDDTAVTFKTDSTYLNNLPVNIDGTCNLSGDMSVNVRGEGQNSKDLLKIINTSPILSELQEMLAPIKSANGKTKIFLNIFGHVNRGVEPVFNKDLFAKGTVELISNYMTVLDYKIPVSNVNGIIHFDQDNGDYNLKAQLYHSIVHSNGVINKEILTANATSDKFSAGDFVKISQLIYGKDKIPYIPGIESIYSSFSGHYQGPMDINNLDYNKITAKGTIHSNLGNNTGIIVNNSNFEIKNSKIKTSPIRGAIRKNPFNLQLDIDNAFSEHRNVNGSFSMKNFNLATLNGLNLPEFPQLKDLDRYEGHLNIASKIKNNNIRLFTRLNDLSVIYRPKHLKIKILNGSALFDKNDLNLNNINAYAGVMPVFIDGKINNIIDNPNLNIYINAKPSQEFFDQFFNSKSVYPIKLKGDVMVASTLRGTSDKLSSKTELKLDESSSLYYMGATIGDLTNPVRIYLDCITSPTSIKINSFLYDKIITSQNNKQFPNRQVISQGTITLLDNNLLKFNNFKVKTENPTDAKIFNIIFKKPFMKQGVFTSDLTINGTSLDPRIVGKLDVTSIDMPMVDTTVKDIMLDFKHDNVFIRTKSTVLNNAIYLNAIMKNRLVPPYTFNDVKLHFEDLDLNRIANAIQDYEADLYKQQLGLGNTAKSFDPSQIIIKKGQITADNIKIRELKAKDFQSDLSIGKDRVLVINNYNFNLADGDVNGNIKYEIPNSKLFINANINNANAQTISEALFDLKGQFYGIVNGQLALNCIGEDQDKCLDTLSGNGQFVINDGRMPKLGSLEYLLKASNLVTGGITGISINGIIDLITPLKTGEFKSITGHYNINNGIVQDLEVFSKGKDLNLYLTGAYNIKNYIAEMEVYGSLSSSITSVFGKIKNLSLNTLLNTIPLLNKNEISPEIAEKINKIPNEENQNISRVFAVDINGDINGLNYVKSFKWVK